MLALLIFVKPGIQVKLVVHTAPPDLDERDSQLGEQRDPNAEVRRRLFLGQTPSRRQRQAVVVHVSPRRPCDRPGLVSPIPWPLAALPGQDHSVPSHRCVA